MPDGVRPYRLADSGRGTLAGRIASDASVLATSISHAPKGMVEISGASCVMLWKRYIFLSYVIEHVFDERDSRSLTEST